MPDIKVKNLCSSYSILLFIIFFSNCTSKAIQNGTELCQSLKKSVNWNCESSDSCWYYKKYKNEKHLDDYTPIQPCGSSEDFICCPKKIYGDDFCQKMKNLNGWKCKFKQSCSHYDAANYQTTSSHVGRDIGCTSGLRKICCPPPPPRTTTTTTTERTPHFNLTIGDASKIVEAKCEEYEKSNLVRQSKCSSGSTFIVDGSETEEKEFPHMAAIGYEIDNVIDWKCGGSLISERFVLSAAHCASYNIRIKPKLVLLGATNLQAIDQNSNAVNYTIIDWIFHPRYNVESSSLNHDIVLFKLNDEVKFSAFVRPICLATFSSSPPKTAVITGYGKYLTGVKASGELLKGNVKIVQNKDDCINDFKDYIMYKNPINASTIICTQNEKRITQDGCYGDSGGPMQTQKKKGICFYELHGIVSSGPYICGDSSRPFSIYTNVSSYIDWIQQEVWPNN